MNIPKTPHTKEIDNYQVKGFGPGQAKEALTGCEIVVIPAGVPRKPGMTRDGMERLNTRRQNKLADWKQTSSTPMPPLFATWPRSAQMPAQRPSS